MTTIKACIFDLDGVIVDTAKYHYLAWKELSDEMGFEFTEIDNERLKGVSRMASLDILLSIGGIELSEDKKLELADHKNKQYLNFVTNMPPDDILPGAREFLNEVRAAGIKTALGSASKNALTILNRLGLTQLFDAIIDGNKVSKAKPDPEVFLKGAEALMIDPKYCVVFEDAEAGIEAAIAGNMKCVGIGSPENVGKANIVIEGLHQMTIQMLETL
jgi:beta-phosphoglucomutase